MPAKNGSSKHVTRKPCKLLWSLQGFRPSYELFIMAPTLTLRNLSHGSRESH